MLVQQLVLLSKEVEKHEHDDEEYGNPPQGSTHQVVLCG
jgi:hypothetical protein